VTQTATSPQRKPLLDEASFQQLLSAAYVLQEHNDRLRAKEVHSDFAKNLSAIVETQKLIQTLQLDLEAAAKLVAERVQKITNASGAAIGMIEKGQLVYRAGTGSASVDQGTRVEPDASLSSECLSKGNAVNYPDALASASTQAHLFRERDVKAFVAVPVYHAGQVAGVLELRFARTNAFRESDLRTAELMAGLLSEAMVTAARMKWKDALASERQSMLEALERIKPQLERLGTETSTGELEAESLRAPAGAPAWQKSEPPDDTGDACSVCGSAFFSKSESFCGICGTARVFASPPPDVPGKDASNKLETPWLTPYGAETPSNGNSVGATEGRTGPNESGWPASLQELIELSAIQQDPAAGLEKFLEKYEAAKVEPQRAQAPPGAVSGPQAPAITPGYGPATSPTSDPGLVSDHFVPPVLVAPKPVAPKPVAPKSEAIVLPDSEALRIVPAEQPAKLQPYPWGSAKKAQHWLETVKVQQGPKARWLAHQWQTRRANIYLGFAVLILIMVISGWGIRSNSTHAAGNGSPVQSAQNHAPAQPNLTLFEKLLVSLGLAEAPPAPVYMGNPDTEVWVDVHTALYHCPGSDLYGKTPDGRMATQRDAQRDQFEPANRKVCP
jgi:putative methionine-R-sulfoxide reductase with GAF domain